jgi:hypothetical protein
MSKVSATSGRPIAKVSETVSDIGYRISPLIFIPDQRLNSLSTRTRELGQPFSQWWTVAVS